MSSNLPDSDDDDSERFHRNHIQADKVDIRQNTDAEEHGLL